MGRQFVEVESKQFGEAYVCCQRCWDFFHVQGEVCKTNGRMKIAPDQERCHCGGPILVLDAYAISTYTRHEKSDNGKRHSHHLRDME